MFLYFNYSAIISIILQICLKKSRVRNLILHIYMLMNRHVSLTTNRSDNLKHVFLSKIRDRDRIRELEERFWKSVLTYIIFTSTRSNLYDVQAPNYSPLHFLRSFISVGHHHHRYQMALIKFSSTSLLLRQKVRRYFFQ